MINYVNLRDLTKLANDKKLSEKYVNYICGFKEEHQYRHDEIEIIYQIVSSQEAKSINFNNFLYSYSIPQLNKEFDLLYLGNDCVINLELKSEFSSIQKIEHQLISNKHYLKLISNNLKLYVYVKKNNKLYILNDNKLIESDIKEFYESVNSIKPIQKELDMLFSPKNILVSPLNSPDKFINSEYLLTENQTTIKKEILDFIKDTNDFHFCGLTGSAGTGKTLLLYDIVKTLSKSHKVIVVHSGILCDGHYTLNSNISNIKIIPAKDLRYREIKDVDLIVVDEAHRLYESILDKIERWIKKEEKKCVFTYDEKQKMSNSENRRKTMETILKLCDSYIYKLTNKIRTNKEIALFITCLRDLSKYRKEYLFNNVKIIFEPDKKRAVEIAKQLKMDNYTYISYTPSFYDFSLHYQISDFNTHEVIGQEFDGVVMIMDENFFYEKCFLKGKTHPNPDYIYTQLLYQGLTRTREKLALIITDESLLENVLMLF